MKFSVAFLLVSACHVHGFVLSPQHTITPRPSSYDLVGCSKRSTSFGCNTRTCASTKLNAATAMAGAAYYADDGNLHANYAYGPGELNAQYTMKPHFSSSFARQLKQSLSGN